MAETQVTQLKTPKQRARSKKKENRKVVVSKSSEGSVAMSEADASATDEDTRKELNRRTKGVGLSGVQNEDPMEEEVESSEERTETRGQVLPPSERTQPSEKECRVKEERRTKDLQREIVAMKTKRMEL